jgi:IstB-like ATP binding protein
MLITANQPFGEWGKIFSDQAMTLAAIDRIVHHATILEMNVDSYRRKEAADNARGPGRPADARDNQGIIPIVALRQSNHLSTK